MRPDLCSYSALHAQVKRLTAEGAVEHTRILQALQRAVRRARTQPGHFKLARDLRLCAQAASRQHQAQVLLRKLERALDALAQPNQMDATDFWRDQVAARLSALLGCANTPPQALPAALWPALAALPLTAAFTAFLAGSPQGFVPPPWLGTELPAKQPDVEAAPRPRSVLRKIMQAGVLTGPEARLVTAALLAAHPQ